jgi:response regulator RpfG family c-di-GMP phosphodiesterase
MRRNNGQTIVIVDDEKSMRDYLSEVLFNEGYQCESFCEGLAALAFISEQEQPVDLVFTDINMPGMGGLDLLRTATAIFPSLPVIMVSGACDLDLATEALRGGATDYLLKPATPADIAALARKHLSATAQADHVRIRQALANLLTVRTNGTPSAAQLHELFQVVGFKRYETLQHSKRVAEYAKLLGQACGFSGRELTQLQLGALLHDIGKVAIPRNILLKPAALSEEEVAIMRLHPRVGWDLLAEFEGLGAEAEVVYAHHERFDGTGYPRRLKGENISIAARIFSIVDTFDAITSDRPYRAALSIEQARAAIVEGRGTQFDPLLVDLFAELPDEMLIRVKEMLPETSVQEEKPSSTVMDMRKAS